MSGWIGDIVSGLISNVVDAITGAAQSALNWVLTLLDDGIFHSPDLTALPQVATMSARAQLVANAAMTLIVVVVGLIAMTHGTLQDRHALKELLPRMVIGFAAANMATPIVRGVVAAGNALTEALAGGGFTDQDSFDAIRRSITGVSGQGAGFLIVLVLQLMVTWMLVFVIITWLGRLSVLLVVAATGPAALICHAIPFTEPVARIWWRSLLSCLAVQILQAVTLHMAVATLLTPGANLPALGLPNDPTGLLDLVIACFLLWLVIRIPTFVTRAVGGTPSRAGSVIGSVVRLIVVQRLLGAVGLRGGGRARIARRATAAGAAPRAAGPRAAASTAAAQYHQHHHLHMHPPATASAGAATRPPYRAGPASAGYASRAGRPPAALQPRALPAPPVRRALGS
jgi:hypothetical protein